MRSSGGSSSAEQNSSRRILRSGEHAHGTAVDLCVIRPDALFQQHLDLAIIRPLKRAALEAIEKYASEGRCLRLYRRKPEPVHAAGT